MTGASSERFDFVVIGGGIAGVSAAYELAQRGRVALIEQESQAGFHSTARSAAAITEAYGPEGWQILSTASRSLLAAPPEGFADHPLLSDLGALYFARGEEVPALEQVAAGLARRGVRCEILPAEEAGRMSPAVKTEGFVQALHEPDCMDIDTNALLQGYLRLARRRGAVFAFGQPVEAIARQSGVWRVATDEQVFEAPLLINAAGAWADPIAELAGLPRRGLTPHRRTAITFDPPPGMEIAGWPMTFDLAETWYFKPEGGRIMVSPVDVTPSDPCDCYPEELDIAIAADRIQQATTLTVTRIASSWAGLRTFVEDHEPVIGPDPQEPSFVWLAGQGGNGVMAAPAAARLAAALACGDAMPDDLRSLGLTEAMIAPSRLSVS